MNAPEFKPLPSLGGSIADRLARSEKAREVKSQIEDDKAKAPPEPVSEQLTPAQVKNWRLILFAQIGPWAMIMPESEIQTIRDRIQAKASLDSGLF